MTDDAARRPLRIIAVQTPAQPLPPAAQQQVERFQRALLPARVAAIDKPVRSRTVASTATSAPAAGSEPDPGPHAPADAHGATTSASSSTGVVRPRPPITTAALDNRTLAAPEATAEAPPEPDDPNGSLSVDPDQGGTGGWDEGLVRLIVALCRQTDASIEAWSVTVPLDQAVLPDTALELSLSRHRLSLRFVTQSVASHRLLSRHRDALATKLQRGLNSSREVDIEVN